MITPSVSTDEIKTDEIKTDNASISVTNPNKYLYKSCCLLIDKRFAEFMVKLLVMLVLIRSQPAHQQPAPAGLAAIL